MFFFEWRQAFVQFLLVQLSSLCLEPLVFVLVPPTLLISWLLYLKGILSCCSHAHPPLLSPAGCVWVSVCSTDDIRCPYQPPKEKEEEALTSSFFLPLPLLPLLSATSCLFLSAKKIEDSVEWAERGRDWGGRMDRIAAWKNRGATGKAMRGKATNNWTHWSLRSRVLDGNEEKSR